MGTTVVNRGPPLVEEKSITCLNLHDIRPVSVASLLSLIKVKVKCFIVIILRS